MSLLKFILTIAISFTFLYSSFAQKSGIRTIDNDSVVIAKPHLFRVGITPSALLNEYLGIQINGAINISQNYQFNLEAGQIICSSTFDGAESSGYRIRPALRFYPIKRNTYQVHFSLGYNIRKTTSQRSSIFSVSGGSVYSKFEQDRTIAGPAFLAGIDFWVFDDIILDFGLGLGLSKLTIVDRNIPSGGIRDFMFMSFDPGTFREIKDRPGTYRTPLLIVNIRIQYPF